MQIKRQQTGAGGGGAETTAGVGFPQQCPLLGSEPLRGDQDGQPNQGSPLGPKTLQGRPKGGSAEKKKKKKPTKQTLYADREDPAGSVVSCPTPWAGSRADGRGYMTLPLGNPHHGRRTHPPSRRGRGCGGCDQVQESSTTSNLHPPSHAFLQEQRSIQVYWSLSSLPCPLQALHCWRLGRPPDQLYACRGGS